MCELKSKSKLCLHLFQMEDGGGDALDSIHCVFRVFWFFAFHHYVFVQVKLPLDCWVIRLQRNNITSMITYAVVAYSYTENRMIKYVNKCTDVVVMIFVHLAYLFLKM